MSQIEIKRNINPEIMLGIYILGYFFVNLLTLTNFPFIHSDESWLSGLTRNMMETGSPGVTETFFDLKPRYPHSIKTLFHLMQMPFISIFGYQVFSVRLLSLSFGCLGLVSYYGLLKSVLAKTASNINLYPLLGTILMSLDLQFIYASHFARQEIVLVLCIILCLYALSKQHYVAAAVITGLSIGIHPNSFLVGTMCAAILFPIGIKRGHSFAVWKPFLRFTAVTAIFATCFIAVSLYFDKDFFRHYFEYGNSEFEVGAPITSKFAELPYFLEKIWHGVSGTYYVPDVKVEMLLFAAVLVIAIPLVLQTNTTYRREMVLMIKGLAGIFAGMILIGRYNQTSIIFLFPPFFTLIILVIDKIHVNCISRNESIKKLAVFVLILLVGFNSYHGISPWMAYSYDAYLQKIATSITSDSKVLGNLNSEFYFENGKLLDYRNLSFLKENNLSIEDYIKKNKIEYIILSDELDLIYSQRPVWNIIYGNLRYLDELHEYTRKNCVLVDSFQDNTYGVRIVQYMNSDRNFTIQIFKVNNFSR